MTDHILPHNHGEHLNTELLIDNIAKTEDFQIVADLFKVLGDNSRVRIFWLLCHCEECVINISSMMDMSSPAVSHHLRQLKSYGLITSRREGKEVYYKAADKPGSAASSHDRAGDQNHMSRSLTVITAISRN